TEAGKNDPRLLPPAGDPHEPPRSVDCAAAVQDNAVVVAAALLKDVDCLEGVALGHADNEVDASRKKLVEHLVGRVAAIQHEDITRFQMRQQRQQLNGCGSAIERSRLTAREMWCCREDWPQVFVEKELVQTSAPPYRMQDANRAS